ncbi:MAG: nitrophenyl compound nitroreductase subunit ArsF family protein [Fibrobacterota bacterium]
MNSRRFLSITVGVMLFALTAVFTVCQSSEASSGEKSTPATEASTQKASTKEKVGDKVITVYYFHTTKRCHSCNLIEEFTKKAVEENFAEQIKNGRVVVKAVNIDKEENKHFIKDYKLYTKSVIVSEGSEGKELRWKNLDQVWMLLRDQNKFGEYIETEIGNYLKG